MDKKVITALYGIVFLLLITISNVYSDTLYAGLECAEYHFWPFPSASWLTEVCHSMASSFPGSIPTINWVVNSFDESTNEEFFDYFDDHGVAVLLQVSLEGQIFSKKISFY